MSFDNISAEMLSVILEFLRQYSRINKFIDKITALFKKTIEVDDFKQAILLIESGRADITITSRETEEEFLTELDGSIEDIIIHQPPLKEITLHVYINFKLHPGLAQKLSKILVQMKRDGHFNSLTTLPDHIEK